LSSEARKRLNVLLSAARPHRALLAQARCALSIALEMQGHFRESLDAVSMYEDAEMSAKLDSELSAKLQIQIALAYNYNRDHPKAISLLKSTLREVPEDGAIAGAAYTALARVYRTITEYPIARDYSTARSNAIARVVSGADWRKLISDWASQTFRKASQKRNRELWPGDQTGRRSSGELSARSHLLKHGGGVLVS